MKKMARINPNIKDLDFQVSTLKICPNFKVKSMAKIQIWDLNPHNKVINFKRQIILSF